MKWGHLLAPVDSNLSLRPGRGPNSLGLLASPANDRPAKSYACCIAGNLALIGYRLSLFALFAFWPSCI